MHNNSTFQIPSETFFFQKLIICHQSITLLSSQLYLFYTFLRTILSKANSDASERDFVITISQDTFTFDYQPSTSMDGQYTSFDVSVNLSPNYYHHVAVTVYQEDFALYINGSVVNATGLDGSINDGVQPVLVGALPQGESPRTCIFNANTCTVTTCLSDHFTLRNMYYIKPVCLESQTSLGLINY